MNTASSMGEPDGFQTYDAPLPSSGRVVHSWHCSNPKRASAEVSGSRSLRSPRGSGIIVAMIVGTMEPGVSYLFPFFVLFATSGIYLWLLGGAFLRLVAQVEANGLAHALDRMGDPAGTCKSLICLRRINEQTVTGLVDWVRRRGGRSSCGFAGALDESDRRSTVSQRTIYWLIRCSWERPPLLAFFPVFNACTKEMILYDLGLYYLKAVRWIATYPIVPGLANVQGHLGFNQSGFLFTTLFDAILPERWGIFLVGGILPWLGLASSLFALFCLGLHASGKLGSPRSITVAYACSLPVWIYAFLYENLSSGSPNLIVACVMIHLFLVFACFLFSPDEQSENLGEILVIGAACLCLKLTSLGFVLSIWAIAVGCNDSSSKMADPRIAAVAACPRNMRGHALRVGLSRRLPFRLPIFPVEFSRGTRGLARARLRDERLSRLYSALVALSPRRRGDGPPHHRMGSPLVCTRDSQSIPIRLADSGRDSGRPGPFAFSGKSARDFQFSSQERYLGLSSIWFRSALVCDSAGCTLLRSVSMAVRHCSCLGMDLAGNSHTPSSRAERLCVCAPSRLPASPGRTDGSGSLASACFHRSQSSSWRFPLIGMGWRFGMPRRATKHSMLRCQVPGASPRPSAFSTPPRVSPEASNTWNLEWYPAWSRIDGQNRAREILRSTPRLLERHEIPGHISMD